MLYSFGRKDIYDPLFANDLRGFAIKAGRGSLAEDGSASLGAAVFRTAAEASIYAAAYTAFVQDNCERYVIGVDADWDRDTYQIEGETFRRLTRDALVWRLE